MPKPLLFLDVDGVLNPDTPDDHFETHTLLDWPVHLSPRHGDWLRELAGPYKLCWATTWEEDANRHIAPLLGLPRLPVVRFAGYVPGPDDPRLPVLDIIRAAKWAPLLRYAEGRPFAWVDDLIPGSLRRRSLWRRDRLLLRTDPAHGLQRHHVERLLARPPRPRLTAGREQST
ncbi:HAD domain-containing protein [Kitasatospora sp. McL0602]|uniref:HAD domain-containing protein n=1 Tax=Kitasatospora sp. McL0602 TaxID=3439530 RepID=UPI003F8C6706